MKNIYKTVLSIAVASLALVSCETYKTNDPDTTAIAPMDGEYVCWAYDPANLNTPKEWFEVYLSATTMNDPDKVWVIVNNYLPRYPYTISVCFKADCKVSDLTFSGKGKSVLGTVQVHNYFLGQTYYTTDHKDGTDGVHDVTISNGKIVINGMDTPSGYKTDSIYFEYTVDGTSYVVKGGRYTLWEDDYKDFANFADNY